MSETRDLTVVSRRHASRADTEDFATGVAYSDFIGPVRAQGRDVRAPWISWRGLLCELTNLNKIATGVGLSHTHRRSPCTQESVRCNNNENAGRDS